MDMRQLVRFACYAAGVAVAAALAIVMSGRYGSTAYALAGLAALAWTLVFAAVCRRPGRAPRKGDETAVIWGA
jgi:hypothetical protein